MRFNRIRIIDSWKGKKIFKLNSKEKAMEQFIKSGAAAGFVEIIDERYKDKIINRIGELLKNHHTNKDFIPIIHRYIAAVGEKN